MSLRNSKNRKHFKKASNNNVIANSKCVVFVFVVFVFELNLKLSHEATTKRPFNTVVCNSKPNSCIDYL